MRFFRRLVIRLLDRAAQVLRAPEDKRLLPKEFLEQVLCDMPDHLTLQVIGPSLIANFSYIGPSGDIVCSTSWYPDDGVMPVIYRTLLHEGTKNNGVIKDPFLILSAHHLALSEYLGGARVRASLRPHDGMPDEYPEA